MTLYHEQVRLYPTQGRPRPRPRPRPKVELMPFPHAPKRALRLQLSYVPPSRRMRFLSVSSPPKEAHTPIVYTLPSRRVSQSSAKYPPPLTHSKRGRHTFVSQYRRTSFFAISGLGKPRMILFLAVVVARLSWNTSQTVPLHKTKMSLW